MRLAKTFVVVAAAAVFVTSVATAGAATRQQDRQRLKDATCTSQTCIPTGDAVKAQNGQKATKGQKAQNGAQAQKRRQDGSCTAVAAIKLRTKDKIQDRLHLQDGSCLTA